MSKPLVYDFPRRLRGLSAAERELRRLERSMSVATHRGDAFAFAYLDRRHKRASQALHVVRWREQNAAE
ncbi:hypothetical protein ACIBBG_26805 [Micromonospora chersina]|uniref:hypothetical protein n=1 Tax=Micromonospora chersina TaxID=47854 RepID=UPI0037B31030